MIKKLTTFMAILFFASMVDAAPEYIHHDLKVNLKPADRYIRVIDTIHLPGNLFKNERIHFLLHGNLSMVSQAGVPGDITIEKEKGELKGEFFGINTARFEIKKKIPLTPYSLRLRKGSGESPKQQTITITYEGTIHHPLEKMGEEYARGFSETPGIICDQGIYLAGASFWVPWFNEDLVTFKLETSAPQPWVVLSQGKRLLQEEKNGSHLSVWDSPEPMEEVYLVAGKFKEYRRSLDQVDLMAFLRSQDETLANKFLETTAQYLEMYEKLIGPYPYSKFALVENFWETGYGMPSFILLGSKVIRFPFILHSSYPHELLHNWWGNGVFVDYEAGNWCEGLTAYLADHLIKEQRSQGAEYRKTTLQDYTHYAAGKKEEFPLTQFQARYNALSSSIGYGKSLMVYHMLRQQVGDLTFQKSLRHFYNENKFKKTSFADIKKSVETITGKSFNDFFQQWVTRIGAPEIRLSRTKVEKKANGFLLRFSLDQVQEEKPYALRIPAAISLEGEKEPLIKHLDLTKKHQEFEFSFDQPVLRIAIDPQFDVFRKLHTNEIPPTLSSAFGAQHILVILPSRAPGEFLKGYKELAENWAKDSQSKIDIKPDNQVATLPPGKAIWVLGGENLHKPSIQKAVAFYRGNIDETSVTLDNEKLFPGKHSIVVAVKNKDNPGQVVVWLSTDQVAALPGLGRKLPHYGKYSYLGFEGEEPTNICKGEWTAVDSPLSVGLGSSTAVPMSGTFPPREPLARLLPLFSTQRLMKHIRYLASEELEGRGLGSQGLEKAAQYIANAFKEAGLKPGGDNNSYYQTWEAEIGPDGVFPPEAGMSEKPLQEGAPGVQRQKITLRNVIGIIPGSNPQWADQAVILCAHYDHLGLGLGWPRVHQGNEGKIHYGADDNASGVAVMLELAHALGNTFNPERTLVFIAFTGEEGGFLGSTYYLKDLENKGKNRLKNIIAAVNLDTVGRLTGGKKLMVIGDSSAREWKFIFMGIGYTTGVQTEPIPQPLDAGDQVSFIRAGIPGIQLCSGAHSDYHRPGDTIDKIEAPGLVKVATVAREAIVYLSEKKEPLTFTGTPAGTQPASTSPGPGRQVGTGMMPDFSFAGKGVKIGMVSPGSPAEKAGLKKDDVIIKLGAVEVADLGEYSNALKAFNPGDTVMLVYLREGKEYSTAIILAAR